MRVAQSLEEPRTVRRDSRRASVSPTWQTWHGNAADGPRSGAHGACVGWLSATRPVLRGSRPVRHARGSRRGQKRQSPEEILRGWLRGRDGDTSASVAEVTHARSRTRRLFLDCLGGLDSVLGRVYGAGPHAERGVGCDQRHRRYGHPARWLPTALYAIPCGDECRCASPRVSERAAMTSRYGGS